MLAPFGTQAPPARPKVPPELLLAPLWAPKGRPRRPQGPSDSAPATKTTPLASIKEAPGLQTPLVLRFVGPLALRFVGPLALRFVGPKQ